MSKIKVNMGKVYVVYVDESYDLDQSSYILGVYDNIETARAVKDERVDFIKQISTYDTTEEDEDTYEAYNEGTYLENHYCVYVVEKELKGEK